MQKKTRNIIIVCAAILVLILGSFAAARYFTDKAADTGTDLKTITVEVVFADGTSEIFAIETKEEYLRGALDQEGLIEGIDNDFGLYVTTVAGVAANDANQEWWSFTKDGETLITGVDDTPIADGDHFEITLTVGW